MGIFQKAPTSRTWAAIADELSSMLEWANPQVKQTRTGDLFLFVRLSPSTGGLVTYGRGNYFSLTTDVDADGDPVNNGLSEPEFVAEGSATPEYLARCIVAMCTGALEGYVYRYQRGAADIPDEYGDWAVQELRRLEPHSQVLLRQDVPVGQREPMRYSAETSGTDSRTCPYCAETIKRAAVKCRYCQSHLDPVD